MFNARLITVTLTLAISAVALAISPLAGAQGGNGIRVSGACTQHSTSTLKVSREDRGLELEFEVDQNRAGVPWHVTLKRNGAIVASKTAVTRGPSGSFTIRRVASGAHGTITAVATRASGERCSASATI